jgi:cytokinin dehydrogenase
MNRRISRRNFVISAAAASSATIIGFDPRARSWVTQAKAQAQPFQDIPKLDGGLLIDEASRTEIAVDAGNLFHKTPAAVLRPASVQDIVRMVHYANMHTLKIAIKGDGHSYYGQTQAERGIVIDSRTLRAVDEPTMESVDAQPGAFWSDVVIATLAKNLTPRVYPGSCMALTVGGTLSVGGIGFTSHRNGALVDNVMELDVVTGDGRFVTCSPDRESGLFDMVLAGLGQCGIIVRARIPLVPAPSHVVLRNLIYTDLERYLADQLRVAMDGRFDSQAGYASRNRDGGWTFMIEVGKFFLPPAEPNLASLVSDLQFDTTTSPARMTYQDYLFRFETETASFASSRPGAAITMWIPASATRHYFSDVLARSPDLAGLQRVTGLQRFTFLPMNTGRFTRPMFRVPKEDQAFGVWLVRKAPSGDQEAISAMVKSNGEMFAKMTAVGGKRYTPYSGVMSAHDWAEHFGPEMWRRLSEAKKRFDPNNVLTPGAGMFV